MDRDQIEIEEAKRRSELAKASLRSHLRELERRFEEVKDKLHPGAHIARHPIAAVGIALVAGALLGLVRARSRARAPTDERTSGSTIMAALGAVAIKALKDAALREGAAMAKGWWADRTERNASRDPSVEAFLEH